VRYLHLLDETPRAWNLGRVTIPPHPPPPRRAERPLGFEARLSEPFSRRDPPRSSSSSSPVTLETSLKREFKGALTSSFSQSGTQLSCQKQRSARAAAAGTEPEAALARLSRPKGRVAAGGRDKAAPGPQRLGGRADRRVPEPGSHDRPRPGERKGGRLRPGTQQGRAAGAGPRGHRLPFAASPLPPPRYLASGLLVTAAAATGLPSPSR
jgi:hypothetical protein